jgi:hypothetical protein
MKFIIIYIYIYSCDKLTFPLSCIWYNYKQQVGILKAKMIENTHNIPHVLFEKLNSSVHDYQLSGLCFTSGFREKVFGTVSVSSPILRIRVGRNVLMWIRDKNLSYT